MHFSSRIKRLMVIAGITLAAACAINPIHSRLLQAWFFSGTVLAWCGLFLMAGRGKKIALFLAAISLLALLLLALPKKPIDQNQFREDYVARMRSFDETRYVWGGESSLGIDCSGLPRRALRDTLWSEGWKHANGFAFRSWLDLWWHDSSALAMSQSYRNKTRSLSLSGPLWEVDESKLIPGDLAVRGDGRHVVIFLGNHQWIEADPTWGKVHIWTPTPSDGTWFENMSFHRWLILEP